VAKYVATSIREAGFDVASMARTSTKGVRARSHGRHAGWITAACGLAAEKAGDAPQILLFPEITFDAEKFLARVDATVKQYGYCAIGVSEGIRTPTVSSSPKPGSRTRSTCATGGVAPQIANLVKDKLGYKYHWAVADYLQRAARHIASKTDAQQAYAVAKPRSSLHCRAATP